MRITTVLFNFTVRGLWLLSTYAIPESDGNTNRSNQDDGC